MASSISLRIVALISSSLSIFLTLFNSKFVAIIFYFDSKKEIKTGSKTTLLKLLSDLVLNKECSNFRSNSISCKLTNSCGNELTLINETLASKSSICFFFFPNSVQIVHYNNMFKIQVRRGIVKFPRSQNYNFLYSQLVKQS